MSPKDKLFKGYINLEFKLLEFVRCRTLHQKHIEWNAANSSAWVEFARFEAALDDQERARAIFELAVTQPELDMPELVWRKYIDFEESEGEIGRARAIFERLLEKTSLLKVWIAYVQFEIENSEGEGEDDTEQREVSEEAKARGRKIFERAYKTMRDQDLKEDRVALLNSWKAFEEEHGSEEDIEKVLKQMPRKVKNHRRIDDDSYEEYVDYIFPADDESAARMSKLLANVAKWKQEQAKGEAAA